MSIKKSMKLIGIAGFLFILLLLIIFDFANRPVFKNSPSSRINRTRIALITYRSHLNSYYESNGSYPRELNMIQISPEDSEFLKDFISFKEGSKKQYQNLNGKGGWFYNADTGKIKVNVDKPIIDYFPNYKGKDRNEIPSEW